MRKSMGPGELLAVSQDPRQKKKISQRPVTTSEENKSPDAFDAIQKRQKEKVPGKLFVLFLTFFPVAKERRSYYN